MNVDLKVVVEQALAGVVESEPPRKAPSALAVDDTQLARMEEAFGSSTGDPIAPPD